MPEGQTYGESKRSLLELVERTRRVQEMLGRPMDETLPTTIVTCMVDPETRKHLVGGDQFSIDEMRRKVMHFHQCHG